MPKSRSRNKRNASKKDKKRTRHIPKAVSDSVLKRHFFECAWDGVPLTERHHIKEWHLGGEHSEDNLILLCPNCHTLVHNGTIKPEELATRKSTHLQGDRISGGFRTTLNELKVNMGSNIITGAKHLIAFGYQPILTTELENENLFVSASFYDKNRNLIFWMRRNMYWAPSHYTITSSLDNLLIYDEKINVAVLKLHKEGDYMFVECSTYLRTELIEATAEKMVIAVDRGKRTLTDCVMPDPHIAFWICNEGHTEEGFFNANSETTYKTGSGIIEGFDEYIYLDLAPNSSIQHFYDKDGLVIRIT